MLRTAHLDLIARHSVRHGIRGGAGLVSIALTLLIGLGLANCALAPLDLAQKQVDVETAKANLGPAEQAALKDKLDHEVIAVARRVLDWAVDPSESQRAYLTDQKPAMVSAILVLLMIATPFFACLGGFNQTSGDIASKGLRFLLIRTERQNIFIGRFIGTFVFAAFVNLLLFAIIALYAAAKIKVHAPGDMALWTMEGYVRTMIYALPYIAFCAWISSAIDSPFGSLAVALMSGYFVPILIGQAANAMSAVGYAQYLTPWGFKYWLLEPVGLKLFGGVLAMLGFTALFLFLGLSGFKKRDL